MKRLDRNQKIVLGLLKNSGGRWKLGDPIFGSEVRTEKVLDSLVCTRLVARIGAFRNYGIFELTPSGQEVAATL